MISLRFVLTVDASTSSSQHRALPSFFSSFSNVKWREKIEFERPEETFFFLSRRLVFKKVLGVTYIPIQTSTYQFVSRSVYEWIFFTCDHYFCHTVVIWIALDLVLFSTPTNREHIFFIWDVYGYSERLKKNY